MSKLHKRLPSKKEMTLLFSACVFPIHIWAYFLFLAAFPALILRARIGQLIGVFSYVFSIALIESLVLLVILLLVSILLPAKYFRDHFVALGTSLALTIVVWAIAVKPAGWNMEIWHVIPLVIAILCLFVLIPRYQKFAKAFLKFSERVTVLSLFYVSLDLLGLGVVFIRNIT